MNNLEIYPTPIPRSANLAEIYDEPLYYVEFHRYDDLDPWQFKIMYRSFTISKEDYLKNKADFDNNPLISIEGHGYNLMDGRVDPPGRISLTTKTYLKYLVDALNEKEMRERQNK